MRRLMPEIARHTRGCYYDTEDAESLTDIFVDIFHNLPAILAL